MESRFDRDLAPLVPVRWCLHIRLLVPMVLSTETLGQGFPPLWWCSTRDANVGAQVGIFRARREALTHRFDNVNPRNIGMVWSPETRGNGAEWSDASGIHQLRDEKGIR